MNGDQPILEELRNRFIEGVVGLQATADSIPTIWISPDKVQDVLGYLKTGIAGPFRTLYDLTAVDERETR